MPAPKMQYLNQKLSEYLNDKVSNYNSDGSIYSSSKRDEYLVRAMNYLFRITWNYSNVIPTYSSIIFPKLMPDLIKKVSKTSSNTTPAKFILDSNTSDLYHILSISRNSDKKILTKIPIENSLIAESGTNSVYNFDNNNPAYYLINNEIVFIPSTMTNMSFTMLYIKYPVQDDGNIYSSNGNYDIPFKSDYYIHILNTAKAFALYDSQEIDYGQLMMQLSLVENEIIKRG